MPVNSPGYPRRPSRANITPEQYRLIQRLRERNPAENPPKEKADLGSHLADLVASTVGSWKYRRGEFEYRQPAFTGLC